MASIAIPYGTTEGQTAKIAAYSADAIRDHGHEARAVDVKGTETLALAGHDAVISGASMHLGKHDKHVRDVVAAHRDARERLPSAFFPVSLAAYDNRAEAEGSIEAFVREFVRETGRHPGKVGLFCGAADPGCAPTCGDRAWRRSRRWPARCVARAGLAKTMYPSATPGDRPRTPRSPEWQRTLGRVAAARCGR